MERQARSKSVEIRRNAKKKPAPSITDILYKPYFFSPLNPNRAAARYISKDVVSRCKKLYKMFYEDKQTRTEDTSMLPSLLALESTLMFASIAPVNGQSPAKDRSPSRIQKNYMSSSSYMYKYTTAFKPVIETKRTLTRQFTRNVPTALSPACKEPRKAGLTTAKTAREIPQRTHFAPAVSRFLGMPKVLESKNSRKDVREIMESAEDIGMEEERKEEEEKKEEIVVEPVVKEAEKDEVRIEGMLDRSKIKRVILMRVRRSTATRSVGKRRELLRSRGFVDKRASASFASARSKPTPGSLIQLISEIRKDMEK